MILLIKLYQYYKILLSNRQQKGKEKQNQKMSNEVGGLLLNVLSYDVPYVFKRLSRCAKTLFKFAFIPIIIPFTTIYFVIYFQFSLSFLLPVTRQLQLLQYHQCVLLYHLHSSTFSYAISDPVHLYPLHTFTFSSSHFFIMGLASTLGQSVGL